MNRFSLILSIVTIPIIAGWVATAEGLSFMSITPFSVDFGKIQTAYSL
jgi:hypothetical protein